VRAAKEASVHLPPLPYALALTGTNREVEAVVADAVHCGRSRGISCILTFAQGLQSLGWAVGENLRIDIRWANLSSDNVPTLHYFHAIDALSSRN
jgi:hypothetical protein